MRNPLKIDRARIGLLLVAGELCVGVPSDRSFPEIDTVLIAGATFTMGTPLHEGQPEYHQDERPLTVSVKSFRIGKFPVTAEQMGAFLNSELARQHDRRTLYNHEDVGEYRFSTITIADNDRYVPRSGAETAPANQVTWKGAVLFCRWISDQTGKQYRLPSEAEWELAARGVEGRTWPWGNDDPGPQHGERYQRSR